MKNKLYKKHKLCAVNSNFVMKNGILIACHHGVSKKELKYICLSFEKFLDKI
jgi:hypothetical protein